MFLKLLTDAERVMEFLHEVDFLGGKRIGICRVDCREVATLHLISFTVNGAYTFLIVDMLK